MELNFVCQTNFHFWIFVGSTGRVVIQYEKGMTNIAKGFQFE